MAALTIHSTLGAVLVGFALACGVYGILAAQFFIGHLVYFYGITNYANPTVLAQGTTTWSFILQLTVGAMVGTIVKTYFGIRVWRFSDRNIWITGLIMLLTFGQLGLALAFSIEAFKLPSVFAVHDLQTLGTVSLGVGVVTDIVTAGALCLYLNRLRTGLKSSDSLVDNLCSYAINTGVLTRLNTRRTVRGRGTDKQGETSNHTNLFALGTRMPSMGPNDLEQWDKIMGQMLGHDNPTKAFQR
ncbi:hypothetical protein JR316_0006936 [Psilocybe cubensis]|uniref:Uncharacterized protein n=1 Tax=Psilocybe cubensis TaxID=181762 RepID=A0ACB8GXH2_PSICU|nr:hypothetical protein JR316_0006936 [Psilocybe cubensis]KAH9480338.1 hypothetical protein JR316_0006936 [Psilocybe cubensis]